MEENNIPEPPNHKRKAVAVLIFVIIVIAGAVSGYLYTQYKKTHISTDDAFIEGRIHAVSSKVPGTVKAVYVRDNQDVKKGDMLCEIEAQDFSVKIQEASSDLASEKGKMSEITFRLDTAVKQYEEFQASVRAAKANHQLQEANFRQAEIDMKRAEGLLREEVIPSERYEKTKTGYEVARAQVSAALEQMKQAEARLETQKAVIKQTGAALEPQKAMIRKKEAQLMSTELNQSYTKIYAPSEGYITRKSVESGNHIQAGQPLMAVVPLGDIWIVANYKETQLAKIKTGQAVEITIDAYPGKKLRGRVESIMSGTGAMFSLFPPENATGNYVKVVQRIPVRIFLEKGEDPDHIMRVGMSVVPTIIIKD
jgi:membrane fusion protein (multidrug efflux system)